MVLRRVAHVVNALIRDACHASNASRARRDPAGAFKLALHTSDSLSDKVQVSRGLFRVWLNCVE